MRWGDLLRCSSALPVLVCLVLHPACRFDSGMASRVCVWVVVVHAAGLRVRGQGECLGMARRREAIAWFAPRVRGFFSPASCCLPRVAGRPGICS